MHFNKIASIALAAAVASAQDMGNATTSTTGPVQNDDLTGFYALLSTYGLLEAVNSATNVTILAPSNEALMALNSSGVQLSPGMLQAIINYHTLNGTIPASAITTALQFPHTHLTNSIYSNVTGGQVVQCGVIDDEVKFFSGLKNNITVKEADLNFTGGVIHIVDGLLTIPGNLTDTLTNTNLTALAGAATALNLTAPLSGLSDVTIFAPNNEAFQYVGDALANLSTTDLVGILSYHVVNNSVLYSSDITNTTVKSMGGMDITVQVIDGSVYINSAKVVNPDILFSGGVIHVIDSVLNPNNTMASNGTASMSSGASGAMTGAFPGVTGPASNVPFTSGQSTPTAPNNAQGPAATGSGAGASTAATGAANAMMTGAVGAAALFGGFAAVAANL